MIRKIFIIGLLIFTAGFLASSFSAQAVDLPDVVINEINPAGGWVELLNTTEADIDLSAKGVWELLHLKDPDDLTDYRTESFNLPKSIPARGLIVVKKGKSLGLNGDVISLDYNPDSGEAVNLRVSYGAVPEVYVPADIESPKDNQSIIRNTDGSLSFSDSSMGWFNDTSAGEPDLSDIVSDLEVTGLSTNLDDLADLTDATDLFFEKNGSGKILFSTSLNLTDQATVNTLKALGEKLSFAQGSIIFSPEILSVLIDAGATLTMSGLPLGRSYSLSDIVVKNSDGELISGDSILSNFSFDAETGTITFNTAHFTSFEVPISDPDLVAPTVEITSPLAEATISAAVSITASSTDDNSGVARVEFYYTSATATDPVSIGTQTATSAPEIYTQAWNTLAVDNGAYDLLAVAYDAQNNISPTSSVSVTVFNDGDSDTTQPEVALTEPEEETTLISTTIIRVSATDDSGISQVRFYLDDGILLGQTEVPGEDGTYYLEWSPVGADLADGEHFLYVEADDTVGNSATSPLVSIFTDTTLPVGTIEYSTTDITNDDVTATVSFNREDITITNNDGLNTYVFTANGTFTFDFTDSYGRTDSVVATVSNIDRDPPVISDVSPAPGSAVTSDTAITFNSSEFTLPRCSVDGLNYIRCSGATFGDLSNFSGGPNVLPQGSFTLYIRDIDPAGNIGLSTYDYIKDTIAPEYVDATSTSPTIIKLKFNEDLQTATTASHFLSNDDFWVLMDDGTTNQVISFTESAGIITLNLTSPLYDGTAATGTLVLNPLKPMSIADLAGNEYTPTEYVEIKDGVAPVLSSAATVSGDSFALTFSEDLKNDAVLAPQASDFSASSF